MGCDFPGGKDEMGHELQRVGASGQVEFDGAAVRGDARMALESLVPQVRRDARWTVWSRVDLGTRCYKSSNRSGPDWRDARGRVTTELRIGRVIDVDDASTITETENIER